MEASKWKRIWVGEDAIRREAAPDEDTVEVTSDVRWDPPSASKVAERPARTVPSDVFLGYVLAIFMPTIGILVGVALIARERDSRGPAIVAWSVVSQIVWVIVAVVIWRTVLL